MHRWRKQFTLDGVVVHAIERERLSTLAEEFVLSFLRYHTAMLHKLLERVPDKVHRSSLVESCARRRLELVSRKQELDRAQAGMFEILGVRTTISSFVTIGCILSQALAYHIVEWLNEGSRVGEKAGLVCTLLYRASRDGWNSSVFTPSATARARHSPWSSARTATSLGATRV